MRYILEALILLTIISSCSENVAKRKKIGKDWVEAKFINDSLIDGRAKFYNSDGILIEQGDYWMGKKNGYSVSYYENGRTKDSLNYTCDILNGEAFRFDRNGALLYSATNFHGFNVGDHAFYSNNHVSEYYFDDFEKRQLVNCLYDTLGRCDSLAFHAVPIIIPTLIEKKMPAINFLAYFPHPPGFEVLYKLTVFDINNLPIDSVTFAKDRLFLDTTLTSSKPDSYFFSVVYKNLENDSLINIYSKRF